jgi:hypothetical protein
VSKQKRREDKVRKVVKSVCTPVAAPPEFKKRLLELLIREASGAGKG